jgi:hypothetical protein
MCVCYNEDCYKSAARRQQLHFQLFHTRKPQRLTVHRGTRTQQANELKEVEPPGRLVRLDELPLDHPANYYLQTERGFDPHELGRVYGVS